MFAQSKTRKAGHLAILILASVANIHGKSASAPKARTATHSKSGSNKKNWTVIVYMAADNDLRGFAARNIKQMAAIGSSNYVNILVQLDIKISGNQKITRRYYIEKDTILHVNANDPLSQKMDSGDPKTLISCCDWAIKGYPAENYALILWNHGTGPIDPASGRIINPTELFTFNPAINKFELDRSIAYLDFIGTNENVDRGVCWDDTTGHYLSNQKMESALKTIQRDLLKGKNFSIIGFDACLMATIEIANILKNYADVMVGSQEVELGTGWNYQKALAPLQNGPMTPHDLADNMVRMYNATYSSVTNDFTQSAVDLGGIKALEDAVNTTAQLLIQAIKYQQGSSITNAIRASRDKELCTHFDEPSYLDLNHLFTNLRTNLKLFAFSNGHDGETIRHALDKSLALACALVPQCAFSNVAGKNLKLAKGLSIYFPERKLHYSYEKINFATSNSWFTFLKAYLAS